jgi:hypothetical protein
LGLSCRHVLIGSQEGNDAADVAEVEASRIKTEGLLDEAEKAMEKLEGLLDQVNNKEWKKIDNRVIGHILRSPPIGLGVSEHRFTEDWGIFVADRTKLGDGFQGNKIDLDAF